MNATKTSAICKRTRPKTAAARRTAPGTLVKNDTTSSAMADNGMIPGRRSGAG